MYKFCTYTTDYLRPLKIFLDYLESFEMNQNNHPHHKSQGVPPGAHLFDLR